MDRYRWDVLPPHDYPPPRSTELSSDRVDTAVDRDCDPMTPAPSAKSPDVGTAPTTMYAGAAELARFPFLDDTSAATAYVAHRAAGRKDLGVMVIGVSFSGSSIFKLPEALNK